LASTTWHTVEFSRNRRASSPVFRPSQEALSFSILADHFALPNRPSAFSESLFVDSLAPTARCGSEDRLEDLTGRSR
jgi:hypothetical protein